MIRKKGYLELTENFPALKFWWFLQKDSPSKYGPDVMLSEKGPSGLLRDSEEFLLFSLSSLSTIPKHRTYIYVRKE